MTGAGAPGAYGIIQCLRFNGERDIRIVGVDMNPAAGCRDMVDVFRTVPPASDARFPEEILRISREEAVDVVLPIVTRELMPLAKAKPAFVEKGIAVCVMDPEPLALANDKAALLSFCRDQGLPTPEFRVADTADEVERALDEMGCDRRALYVKAAQGNGSRGVRYVDPLVSRFDRFFNEKPDSAFMSKEDIMLALRERDAIPRMLVMEALPGVEYSADIVADEEGNILCSAVRKSPVVRSSITLESTVVDEPSVASLCAQIVGRAKLTGNVGFDFRADAQGIPRLLEVNPRLTATVVLNAAAGANFPYFGVKQALGEDIPAVSLRYGVSVHRRYEERYTDERGKALVPFPPKWKDRA